MKLSILIINWNTKHLVRKCLESILQNPPEFEFEVIVLDNASSDLSQEMLKQEFSRFENVKLIFESQNLGFAKGNNRAYEDAEGEDILLLNPDTEVRENALKNMVEYMQKHDEVGITGPKLLNPDGSIQPSVRRFPDVWSSLLIFSGLHRIIKPKKYLMSGFAYDKEAEVDQVMGAALLTRRMIVEELELFDEDFYLWYEEVDFCKRIKEHGWKVMYYPEAEVMHHTAQSFSQLAVWDRKKTVARSLLYYFRKNGNVLEVLFLYILMPPVLLIAWLISLFGIKSKIRT